MNNKHKIELAIREMQKYLPIIEAVEEMPEVWGLITEGTGIATANGYRHALSKLIENKLGKGQLVSPEYEPMDVRPNTMRNIIGRKYGNLTVIKFLGRNTEKRKGAVWLCECDCGKQIAALAGRLGMGLKSCGCYSWGSPLKQQNKRMYGIWKGMKNRCTNERFKGFYLWGGRGISVCERWADSFENFYNDMKDGYADNLTLDRYPNKDGNYEPGNCRWADSLEQGANKSNNVMIEYDGEVKHKQEWCRFFGVTHNAIYEREQKGQSHKYIFDYYKAKNKKRENK